MKKLTTGIESGSEMFSEARGRRGPSAPLLPSPGARILTRKLLRSADPSIREVRARYWSSAVAPFPPDAYFTQAAPWVEARAQEPEEATDTDASSRFWSRRLLAEGERLKKEIQKVTGRTYEFRRVETGFSFVASDGSLARVEVTRRHTLWGFADTVRRVANGTGLLEPHVVAWTLCGIEPILPRLVAESHAVEERMPDGSIATRHETVLRVRVSDLGEDDWRRLATWAAPSPDGAVPILPALARRRGRGRPARLTEKDARLFAVLHELGLVGSGRLPRDTWDRVRDRWNAARPTGEPAATVGALRTRWCRLRPRLQVRGVLAVESAPERAAS